MGACAPPRTPRPLRRRAQVHLWEAGGPACAAVADEEAYDAALALLAAGVQARAPRLVRAAAALLARLAGEPGGCAARGHASYLMQLVMRGARTLRERSAGVPACHACGGPG